MIGYIRYYYIDYLPIGIEMDLDLWVSYEHGDQNSSWAKVSFNRKDIIDDGGDIVRIKKGIIMELDWR